jgi:hypothetical protein
VTRRALGVATAATIVIAGVLGLAHWGQGPTGGVSESAAPVQAVSTLAPATPRFADPVSARLDVLVDRNRIELATMRIAPRFAPYRLAAVERSRNDVGDASLLHYRFKLECLTRACLGAEQARTVFQATIAYRERSAEAPLRTDVTWPELRLSSRLDPSDRTSPKLRAGLVPIAALSYRVSPGTAAWLLTALALLLGFAGVALAVRALAPSRARVRVRRPGRSLGPLERALALLREASARGDATAERKALERLAWELRQAREERLSRAARRLAWSEPGPEPEPVGALTEEVARTVRRNGR